MDFRGNSKLSGRSGVVNHLVRVTQRSIVNQERFVFLRTNRIIKKCNSLD